MAHSPDRQAAGRRQRDRRGASAASGPGSESAPRTWTGELGRVATITGVVTGLMLVFVWGFGNEIFLAGNVNREPVEHMGDFMLIMVFVFSWSLPFQLWEYKREDQGFRYRNLIPVMLLASLLLAVLLAASTLLWPIVSPNTVDGTISTAWTSGEHTLMIVLLSLNGAFWGLATWYLVITSRPGGPANLIGVAAWVLAPIGYGIVGYTVGQMRTDQATAALGILVVLALVSLIVLIVVVSIGQRHRRGRTAKPNIR